MSTCPFCRPETLALLKERPLAFAFRDGYPVSPGHVLIVPRRHVASFFELRDDERLEMTELLEECRTLFDPVPDGFNWGVNDGAAAGQTVPHCHLHLIPRYAGDVDDPRGGIRWVLPEKADYWSDDRDV